MGSYAEPPLTVTVLDAAPPDGNRYELIKGKLYVSAAPSYFHQAVILNLAIAIREYLRLHPIGDVAAGIGIVFDPFNAVVPDLIFITKARKARLLAGGRLVGAPELVVEVLSPGTANEGRDRHLKRELYSEYGVEEYWVFDLEYRCVERFE